MTRFPLWFILLFCGTVAAVAAPLRVLTTFAPIDSLTRSVAGKSANVEMLVPPGVEPHDFSFSPSDIRKVASADVIVINGLGLESWMNKAIANSLKPGAIVIDTSKGIKTIAGTEEDHDHPHAGEFAPNPHIWLDPIRAGLQVENIVRGLSEKDPANIELYKKNGFEMIQKLEALDREIKAALSKLQSKSILTFHDAFPYFAQRYDLKIVGVVEAFPGKEPSPKYLLRLKKTAAEKAAKALFTEPFSSQKTAEELASQLGIPVAQLDPMEAGEPSAALYEKVMRANLKSIEDALGGN